MAYEMQIRNSPGARRSAASGPSRCFRSSRWASTTWSWWYKINRELRDYGDSKGDDLGQSPTNSLLALIPGAFIIIPPLISYWRGTHRIQGAARLARTEPPNGWIALILYLVFGLGFPAYLQYYLNHVWQYRRRVRCRARALRRRCRTRCRLASRQNPSARPSSRATRAAGLVLDACVSGAAGAPPRVAGLTAVAAVLLASPAGAAGTARGVRHVSVPAGARAVNTSHADHVIGDGTPASCTSAAVVAAAPPAGSSASRAGRGRSRSG